MSKEINDVLNTLSQLEPGPEEGPQPTDQALRKLNIALRAESADRTTSAIGAWFRRFDNMLTFNQKVTRFGAAGVLALLVAFFVFSPTGQALASDFLGIFRVQKFAPISISPERLAQLEEMDFEGLYPGDVTWTNEPNEPVEVATLDEAASMAGFDTLAASFEDELGAPSAIAVGGGASGQLVVDLAAARAMLNIAGVDASLLPDSLDGAEISIASEAGVFVNWEDGNVSLVQMPSPEISYPTDFDPAPIGQALLQFLGVEEAEAARLANTIDWTNTLLLPFPQGFGTFEEVTVNGNPGLLIAPSDDFGGFGDRDGRDGRDFDREFDGEMGAPGTSLVWEADGMLYMLAGDADGATLLSLVNNN